MSDIAGRPSRLYCTAAHRRAARQVRRNAARVERMTSVDADVPPRAGAAPDFPDMGWLALDDDALDRLTELDRLAELDPMLQLDRAARLAARLPRVRELVPVDVTALTGAEDLVAPPAPGVPVPNGPAHAWAPRPAADEAFPRWLRGLAVLVTAGLLAGGYAVWASAATAAPPVAAPLAGAPQLGPGDEWVAHAQVTLTSLDRQLDTIERTETLWNQQPRHADPPPAPVQALEERRALLERRKATLQSQLDSYRSLDRTRMDLRRTEQHLEAVETELRDAPPPARRSAEQTSAIAALDEQRDLRRRQRDAKREELRSLQENVESALRTPLPDDGEETAEVSDEVLDELPPDRSEDRKRDPVPARPEVVGGRNEHQEQERQETATSAPPDPRGSRDEAAERPRREPDAGADRQPGRVGPGGDGVGTRVKPTPSVPPDAPAGVPVIVPDVGRAAPSGPTVLGMEPEPSRQRSAAGSGRDHGGGSNRDESKQKNEKYRDDTSRKKAAGRSSRQESDSDERGSNRASSRDASSRDAESRRDESGQDKPDRSKKDGNRSDRHKSDRDGSDRDKSDRDRSDRDKSDRSDGRRSAGNKSGDNPDGNRSGRDRPDHERRSNTHDHDAEVVSWLSAAMLVP